MACTCSGMNNLPNKIDDKSVLITGANCGIGFETALELAHRGGIIHLACRDLTRCNEAKQKIIEKTSVLDDRIICHELDLASFKSIQKFSEQFHENYHNLDILINNAGVMLCPYGLTEQGFEIQMGVNYIGHFLLTNLMLDLIKSNNGGRIIIVSSLAHEKASIKELKLSCDPDNFVSWKEYSKSKLANVLHAKYLANKLKADNVAVVSLHPGVVKTNLGRYMNSCIKCLSMLCSCFIKTPSQGAQTSIYCAVMDHDQLMELTGEYFSDCKVKKSPNSEVNDNDLIEHLWKVTNQTIDEK